MTKQVTKRMRERVSAIAWLVENDASYNMQRRPRRYKGTRTTELLEEIKIRKNLESLNWANDIYQIPNK